PFDIYSKKLIDEKTVDKAHVQAINEEFKNTLESEYAKAKEMSASKVREFMQERWSGFVRKGIDAMLLPEDTTYPDDKLKHIAKVISTVPEGVKFVRKAEKILEGRANMVFETNMPDWGMGETLAYRSLMEEGYNVGISGQVVERGTFSHRHAILR